MTTDYILRVFAPNGRFRIEVPQDASLKRLYKIVAETCHYNNTHSFLLYLEPTSRKHVRHTSSITLNHHESGITNGQILYVKPTTNLQEESINKQSTVVQPEDIHEITQEIQQHQNETDIPKFKSFDHYLKERSFNTVDLPLLLNYRSKELVLNQPNIIPPAVTLKHQEYRHVDHVEFMNIQEMNRFVQYWRNDLQMIEQRGGWLFGYYVEDPHYTLGIRAVVEAIYEPPQISDDSNVIFLPDPNMIAVKQLAQTLGLQCIGYLFTHLPRDELLTSKDIIRMAKYQLAAINESPVHYTGYPVSPFVTVTLSLDSKNNGFEVVTNAFMVSDLGLAFVRDHLLNDENDQTTSLVTLRPVPKSFIVPEILEAGKSITCIDPDWFIVRVNDSAPKKSSSLFKSWLFPVENRKRQTQISDVPSHLRSYPASASSLTPFADFHFIIYIAQLFDQATAAAICECVLLEQPMDDSLVETLKLLQRSEH